MNLFIWDLSVIMTAFVLLLALRGMISTTSWTEENSAAKVSQGSSQDSFQWLIAMVNKSPKD